MKKISICIPTYEMGGYGYIFLDELLTELKMQSFQDFDIIISDQSIDNNILDVCQKHAEKLDITYIKYYYNKGKAACNINNAMKYATGKIIKILYQDDFFVDIDALQKIYLEFENGAKWVIHGFTHSSDKRTYFNTKIPYYSDQVLIGENSVGNPSNFSILSEEKFYMDESLMYVVDCEFYYRVKQKLGLPIVISDILVCARHHPVSAVDNPSFYNLKDPEVKYCLSKHNIYK